MKNANEVNFMYREITEKLKSWKDSKRRKPLLVSGVRQCGKTYIIKEFGETYFDNLVYINFESSSAFSGIFDYDYDINRILQEIETVTGQKITPEKTLLFFDEIQECPKAITSLKYFCENIRNLHVICAGSLLGVAVKANNISFPVGKINRMTLYPMSFREFVIACGYENYISILSSWSTDREIPDLYHVPMTKLLNEYFIVGGMPEAVLEWATSRDFSAVEEIQEEILSDYADDFSKHAPVTEIPKIRWIWDSVPVQLAKENNKFMFSHVKEGKRSAELEDALQWLRDSGLVESLHLVRNPNIPLISNADAAYFKVYMSDIGLLRKKSGISSRTILEGNNLYKEFKGAITENYVFTELLKMNLSPYFWRSGNTAELDFIYEKNEKVIPLEVKAADNTRAKSYRQFCKKTNPETGFRISLKNIAENMCENTRTISLPLYLLWNIENYL